MEPDAYDAWYRSTSTTAANESSSVSEGETA
jgi:hypothetical protein